MKVAVPLTAHAGHAHATAVFAAPTPSPYAPPFPHSFAHHQPQQPSSYQPHPPPPSAPNVHFHVSPFQPTHHITNHTNASSTQPPHFGHLHRQHPNTAVLAAPSPSGPTHA